MRAIFMKRFIFLSVALVAIFAFTSCEQKTSIIGKWQLVAREYYLNGTMYQDEDFTEENLFWKFKEDGTVDIYSNNEFNGTGTYTFDGKILVIAGDEDSETWEVIELTSKTLKWIFPGAESANAVHWIFKKVK